MWIRQNIDRHIHFIKEKRGLDLIVPNKPFEIVVKHSTNNFRKAMDWMQELSDLRNVYVYKSGKRHFVEIRTYSNNYNEAKDLREFYIKVFNGVM